MNVLLAGILAYVALQLVIGFAVSRRIRTEDDYLVAGRRLGYPLVTFSIFATWFGAETCLTASGEVAADGLSATARDPFGYGLCLLLMGLFLARPLWERKLDTLADLFQQRFGKGVAYLAAWVMIPTSVLWAGAQLRAFGHVLASVSDALPLSGWITVAALVALTYTVVGGLLADAWTDLLQGAILLIGLVVLFFAVSDALGGIGQAWAGVAPERLALWPEGQSALSFLNAWALPVIGSLTAQELVARVSAARSATVARRSAFLATGVYVSFGLIPVYLGLVGASLSGGADGDAFLPAIARSQFHDLGYVLFAGALVSAILSTVDSTLLVAGSLLSHNLVVPHLRAPTERTKLVLARAGVMVAGVAALLLALSWGSTGELVEDASGFGSAGIFVIVMFGLFTKFGGKASAFAALIAGVVVFVLACWIGGREDDGYLLCLAAAFLAYVAFASFRSSPRSTPSPG